MNDSDIDMLIDVPSTKCGYTMKRFYVRGLVFELFDFEVSQKHVQISTTDDLSRLTSEDVIFAQISEVK